MEFAQIQSDSSENLCDRLPSQFDRLRRVFVVVDFVGDCGTNVSNLSQKICSEKIGDGF